VGVGECLLHQVLHLGAQAAMQSHAMESYHLLVIHPEDSDKIRVLHCIYVNGNLENMVCLDSPWPIKMNL
jgi:hypothetical protein